MGGNRLAVYECIVKELAKLKYIFEQAHRADTAEGLVDASLYPYPTFETLIYSHHF